MLVFFVMLFAFSTINPVKFQQIAYSFVIALGGGMGVLPSNPVFSPPMPVPPEFIMQGPMTVAQLYSSLSGVKQKIEKEYGAGTVEIVQAENEVRVRIKGDVLFDACSAFVRPNARSLLAMLVPELVGAQREGYRIYVEGHANYTTATCPGFVDDFDISAARAVNVLHYLRSLGVDDSKMAAISYGDNILVSTKEPAKNRRVEIAIRRE